MNVNDKNTRDRNGNSLLMLAIKDRNLDLIERLLEVNDVNQSNNLEETLLLLAINLGFLEVVNTLFIKADLLIEKGNRSGSTPLMIASVNKNPKIVRILLERGAEVNRVNDMGNTALIWASLVGSKSIVELLLRTEGIEVNLVNKKGENALEPLAKFFS